jgi:RNA polymerase sigma factor (sigma-70 family)
MARVATAAVVRQIEALFDSGSVVGLSDRQLLERFNAGRDADAEAAFSALVGRHGNMVLEVCLQLLRDRQHAEDAFQAVFLVLARRARTIRDPDRLANWLYGVALRTARCARPRIKRRLRREGADLTHRSTTKTMSESASIHSPEQVVLDREQAELLHDEINRLPCDFRLAIVLCYFEGLSFEEAASRLDVASGTIGSRLTRAREKLKRGLMRRGVVLSSAALLGVLGARSASAQVSARACDMTARAAIEFTARKAAGGVLSASAVAIAGEVLRGTIWKTVEVIAVSMFTLAAIGSGVKYLVPHPAPNVAENQPDAPARVNSNAAPKPNNAPPGRMIVTGRVVDPEGKPVKGVVFDLVGRPRVASVGARIDEDQCRVLGGGETDADGRVQIHTQRISSGDIDDFQALAVAPGYGFAWSKLNPDAEQPSAEIQLRPEARPKIRLIDVRALPAVGLEVTVKGVWSQAEKASYEGISFWSGRPKGLRAWPQPVTTDERGQLVLTGVGRDLSLTLEVKDLRYARQGLFVKAGDPDKATTLALEPARIIEGRVLAADTGQPIPNAIVAATTRVHSEYIGFMTAKFRADEFGRFKINPIAGQSYQLGAFATGGEPYLIPQQDVSLGKATVKIQQDIKLPRGVSIRGKVTEKGTGRPLSGASIQYIPIGRGQRDILSGWQAIVASQEDGTFQIAVLPGKGHLLVFGPTSHYVLEEIGENALHSGTKGGLRNHAHKIIPYDAKTTDSPMTINAELRRGITVKGRIEGPDAQTVNEALLFTTATIHATNTFWRGDCHFEARDGHFELTGLDPEAKTRVSVLDPEHEWGTTLELSPKQDLDDMTIKLERCGQAKMRFVGPDGKPVKDYPPTMEFVATPGPSSHALKKADLEKLSSDAEFIANVDRKHYGLNSLTDDGGHFTMPALIPRALYRISDFSTSGVQNKGVQIRKEFTTKPGELLDLGDILIEKPMGQ